MWVMYDSVTVSEIPSGAPAVAGYVGGSWPTYNRLLSDFPHAKHLSIAVNDGQRARCLDVEPGDASNAQAPGWFKNLADHSQGKPVLYTSASNVQALINTMSAAGIPRNQYYVWSAHYTMNPHVCGPGSCGYPQADAAQWSDKALGRNLDESLCASEMFGGPPKPKPVDHYALLMDGPFPYGRKKLSEKKVCREFDKKSKHPHFYWHRRRVLWTQIKFLRDRCKYEALVVGRGWSDSHLGERWQLLNDRVKTMNGGG